MLCYKNVGRPLLITVSNGPRTQKDIMKLLCIFAAVLAITLAENDADKKIYEDLEAAETMELMKEGVDLKAAASSYNYIPPSQRPSHWNNPSNYIPQNTWNQEKPVSPPKPIVQPQNDYVAPSQNYPVTWWPTVVTPSTQSSVIKNDIWFGNDGSYNYEYQISDGTHVGEYGYFTDPRRTEESLVKKGWYSYVGADGKVYTVNYYADHTGYHAFGSHLPASPRMVESAGKSVSEDTEENKPSFSTPAPAYYSTPAPTYYPTQAPTVYSTQAPHYYSTQAPHYYSTQAPQYYSTQAPTYNYQHQTHYPHHDTKYQTYGKK